MKSFSSQLAELQALGYSYATAQAKVAHDALLWALHKSGFKKNSTIKGGVVEKRSDLFSIFYGHVPTSDDRRSTSAAII